MLTASEGATLVQLHSRQEGLGKGAWWRKSAQSRAASKYREEEKGGAGKEYVL